MAETCRCLLTFIHSSVLVGIIKNCTELQASSLDYIGLMVLTQHRPTTATEKVHAHKNGAQGDTIMPFKSALQVLVKHLTESRKSGDVSSHKCRSANK